MEQENGSESATYGNVEINFGINEVGTIDSEANAEKIYGSGFSGNVDGDITINIKSGTIGSVFGGGYGDTSNVYKTNISIENARVKNEIYGGGENSNIKGNNNINEIVVTITLKNTIVGKSENNIGERQNNIGEIYGGGKGKTAFVYGNIKLEINSSQINGNIFGGGNAGNVYGNIDVLVKDKTVVEGNVFGGGNSADIGDKDSTLKVNTTVYDTIVWVNNNLENSGTVFGGGNNGTVYGDTYATVGSTDENIYTFVEGQFYAGGKGINSQFTTITGKSDGIISGSNTEVKKYGNSSLGNVIGDKNITFNKFKKNATIEKYKTMLGINNVTNLILNESYVYLSGGLKNIHNLQVPYNSGLLISETSIISGDYTGGGTINIKTGESLTIEKNVIESDTPTSLIIDPIQKGTSYIIEGSSDTPYIVINGKDNNNGNSFVTAEKNRNKYKIYNFNLIDVNTNKFSTNMEDILTETGEGTNVYENSKNSNDTRVYYKDENNNYYFNKQESYKSIYFIEETIVMESYISLSKNSKEDKIYSSEINNSENISILANEAFTTQVKCDYVMLMNEQGEFINNNKFLNIQRSICLKKNGKEVNLPKGTNIIMKTGSSEYYYNVVNEQNIIELKNFQNSSNETFKEINNIQDILKSSQAIIGKFKKYTENYRFIIDFSEAESYLPTGTYEVFIGMNEDGIFETKDINKIEISNRNYITTINSRSDVTNKDGNININLNLDADAILPNNTSDLGKDLILKMSLYKQGENEKIENLVEIPYGTQITLNGKGFEKIEKVNSTTTIIENLQNMSYTNKLDINIDFKNVQAKDQLEEGKYVVKLEFYNSEGNIVFGKKANLTTIINNINIIEPSGYGIKIIKDKSNLYQLIKGEEYRTIKLNYQKGNLIGNLNVKVNEYIENEQNNLQYDKLDNTLVTEKKMTDKNIEVTIYFGAELKKGIYKIEFILYDENNIELTNESINFVVQ